MANRKKPDGLYYNPEIKQKFIDSQKDTMKNNIISIFRGSKDFEERMKKDLNVFTVKELEDYYKYLNKSSVKGIMVVHNAIRRYIRWCSNNGITDSYDPAIEDIKEMSLGQYCNNVALQNVIIDRETIIDWTEKLRTGYEYYNPRDSFLLLAPFEGICGYRMAELTGIKKNQIYTKENKYYADLPNRTIQISRELYNIAQEAIRETQYCRGINKYGTLSMSKLMSNDYVVRLTESKNSKNFGYNNVIKQVKDVLDMLDASYITIKHIVNSGKIHMIKQKSEEHDMSVKNYIWSQYFIDEVCYQFDMSTNNIGNHAINFKILMGLL